MSDCVTITAVMINNQFIKCYGEHVNYYSENSVNRNLLEDIIKTEYQYPQAHIFVVDNKKKKVLFETIYQMEVNDKHSYEDYVKFKEQDLEGRILLDENTDDINYIQQFEEDPWIVAIETDNPIVEKQSYFFNTKIAKDFAIKASLENKDKYVKIGFGSRFRAIYKNGHCTLDNHEIPFLEDDTDHFKYFTKRWNEFKD